MTNRYGSEPLGKSVEEIEQESGNVVNSPVEGEVRRAHDEAALPGVVPAAANVNETGVPGVVINPGALVEHVGPDDGAARPTRDSSET